MKGIPDGELKTEFVKQYSQEEDYFGGGISEFVCSIIR